MKQTDIYIEIKILVHNWVREAMSSREKDILENHYQANKMSYCSPYTKMPTFIVSSENV